VLGPARWLLVLVPAYVMGAATGGLLFWLQHNFEETYYTDEAEWTWADASVKGSTWLALPALLRWCTASIGVHHVHHLNPRVASYRLEEARRAIPEMAAVKPLTREQFRGSFTHIFWDEEQRRMLSRAQLGKNLANR